MEWEIGNVGFNPVRGGRKRFPLAPRTVRFANPEIQEPTNASIGIVGRTNDVTERLYSFIPLLCLFNQSYIHEISKGSAAVEVICRQVSAANPCHATLIYQLRVRNTHMPSLIWTRLYDSSTEEEWIGGIGCEPCSRL